MDVTEYSKIGEDLKYSSSVNNIAFRDNLFVVEIPSKTSGNNISFVGWPEDQVNSQVKRKNK